MRIVEVGPRDGLQNEAALVSAQDKIALIALLAAAGLTTIEAGSFVSSRWVPRMANSDQVLRGIDRRPGVSYPVLVPNAKGLEAALACGAEEVALFAAASETFSQRNTNCSVAESLARLEPVAVRAAEAGVRVRGYVSCVLGCPYEGAVPVDAVVRTSHALHAMGCYEVSLGDTIGVGTPAAARAMVQAVACEIPVERLAVHFHDTYGQALANILACLEAGIGVIDSAVGGLGGCPYAGGANGNVATEDVSYMLAGMGVETGVDLERLLDATRFISGLTGRAPASKAAQAMLGRATGG